MGSYIEKDLVAYDEFKVLDENDNSITGLMSHEFSVELYDPSGGEVSGSIPVTIIEVGSGFYRTFFTPNILGSWTLAIYNSVYFPWGKGGNYECVETTVNNIAEVQSQLRGMSADNIEIQNQLQNVNILVERTLGLTQENFKIYDTSYDGTRLTLGKIRIYPSAVDLQADTNPLATYQITAQYTGAILKTYKVEKL